MKPNQDKELVDIERLLDECKRDAKPPRWIEHLGVILVILFVFAIIFLTP